MLNSLMLMQRHNLLQCLYTLRGVNVFQLFPKGQNPDNSFEAFNDAKQRIITLANMVLRSYVPVQDQMSMFSAKDLNIVLNGFYLRFGIFDSNGKMTRINSSERPESAWPSINQFLHYLLHFRDIIKYVSNSPVQNVSKGHNSRISVSTIEQIISVFGVISLHYQNTATMVDEDTAKRVLYSVFGYF